MASFRKGEHAREHEQVVREMVGKFLDQAFAADQVSFQFDVDDLETEPRNNTVTRMVGIRTMKIQFFNIDPLVQKAHELKGDCQHCEQIRRERESRAYKTVEGTELRRGD